MSEFFKTLDGMFDGYNRVARLYPSLVVLAPLFWTAAALKPGLVGDPASLCGSVVVASALIVLFMNIARARGKTLEPVLITAWGGWRTTALLRHRDPTLDQFTKGRYHAALQAMCSGLTLPTAAEEAANPTEVDERYRSATKRLIEQRRDAKYALLHSENAQYGFRRNLLGMKPIALVIVAATLFIVVFAWWLGARLPMSWGAVLLDAEGRWPIYALAAANAACTVVWLLLIRQSFVLLAANEYAVALFRTLDD